MQTTFKKADIAIMTVLVLCALLMIVFPLLRTGEATDARLTVTYRDGRQETFALAADQTLTLQGEGGHTLTVRMEGGSARVISSTCPDGVCRMGSIRRSGEMLVCQPAGIALTVTTTEGGDADAILG